MQVHSGGVLRATPHYVRALSGIGAEGIARNTFAVFMQPNDSEVMSVPEGAVLDEEELQQWQSPVTFGEFSAATIKKYYETNA